MSETAQKSSIDFTPGALLEARDFSDTWYPAKVVEVDLDEREVLVHFLNWSSRFDEWISMDSARLRPKIEEAVGSGKAQRGKEFQVGDKVIALWKNSKKYPARVTRVISDSTYEVIFYDGFVMEVRAKNMTLIPKEEADKLEIPASNQASLAQWTEESPSFRSELSKEERKKRKQKIDVASLFKSYHKKKAEQEKLAALKSVDDEEAEGSEHATEAPDVVPVTVTPKREKPVSKDKESVVIADPKLPSDWEKKALRRISGSTAGKWDVILFAPDGRAFRSRQEVGLYLQQHNLSHDMSLFDFRLGEEFYKERGLEPPKRAKIQLKNKIPRVVIPKLAIETQQSIPSSPQTANYSTAESIPDLGLSGVSTTPIEDGFRCPLDDCRKLFRRENLLMMHIKHYHPALSKQLGCKSIKVEDMATARTAYDTDEWRALVGIPSPATKPLSAVSSEKKLVHHMEPAVPEDIEGLPLAKRMRAASESKSVEASSPAVAPKIQSAAVRRSRKKQPSLSSEKVIFTIGEPETPTEALGGLSEDLTEDFDLESEYMDQKLDDVGLGQNGCPIEEVSYQKELVHCYCGILEEDGLMIQCELCLAWQHGICLGIESERGVPDPYICQYCRYPYRERISRHYSHDQSWIKKGKVATWPYFEENQEKIPRDSLRIMHSLISASLELKEVLHSLRVQADIAQKKDHPKLYVWSNPDAKEEVDSSVAGPSIPRPEPLINSLDCRLNLLQHINQLQDEIESRLAAMEATLDGLEEKTAKPENPSQFSRTLQTLLKDVNTVKKMASYSTRPYY